jgi:hypothetical protein
MGHPHPDGGGYPDVVIHTYDECTSRPYFLREARRDLLGPSGTLAVYAARPFQFGGDRKDNAPSHPRVALDFLQDEGDTGARFSLSLGDAALLNRVTALILDLVLGRAG